MFSPSENQDECIIWFRRDLHPSEDIFKPTELVC